MAAPEEVPQLDATASAHQRLEALLAANLSQSALQEVLNCIKEGGPYNPSTFNATQLLADVRRQYCGSAFEHHDISSEFQCAPGTCIVSVRKDPVGLIRRLFEACPEDDRRLFPSRVTDEYGQRIYNDFSTAERWNRVQVPPPLPPPPLLPLLRNAASQQLPGAAAL